MFIFWCPKCVNTSPFDQRKRKSIKVFYWEILTRPTSNSGVHISLQISVFRVSCLFVVHGKKYANVPGLGILLVLQFATDPLLPCSLFCLDLGVHPRSCSISYVCSLDHVDCLLVRARNPRVHRARLGPPPPESGIPCSIQVVATPAGYDEDEARHDPKPEAPPRTAT